MYNHHNQYPYLLSPTNTTPTNPNNVQPVLPPNNNGYHTTNIRPSNIGNNLNTFTPMIPSYARATPINNAVYNTFNCNPAHAPAPNMFGNTLYSQSGPPQFVTIVNKATNYISSSPYSLIIPQHHTHTHTQIQSPASPASSASSKISDHDDNNHKNMDAMLQHFDLSPSKHSNLLWKQYFENVSYHQLSMNEYYDEEEHKMNQEITIALCNKCEEHKHNEEDMHDTDGYNADNEDKYSVHSSTVSSSLMHYNATHDHHKDYYHDSCFHFIFSIQNLGVFEFCKYCFIHKNNKYKKQKQKPQHTEGRETEYSPFNLDKYLSKLITEQLQYIDSEQTEDDLQQSVQVELNIDELVTHSKRCGMNDSFVDELKACYAANPVPFSSMDLESIPQITQQSKQLRISIQANAHIHCIVYHPKIGCMEFCSSCNKMRSTFCDNPLTLSKSSVSNLIHESKMHSNTSSLTTALRRLFNFYISPYKDTSLFSDIHDYYRCDDQKEKDVDLNIFSSLRSYMDLNRRLDLAIPKPAGPLAPHAMLRMKSLSGPKSRKQQEREQHRNRSSSSNVPLTTKQLSNEQKERGLSSTQSTQSASFNRYRHQKHHPGSKRRHKYNPQHFRYRYNKRRAAYFHKHKKGKSEFTTHNIICMTPRQSNSPYPESIHSSAEGDKCLSVPPLIPPMLRANSASNITPHVNYGRPISMIPVCHKVNTVELAQSVRSVGSNSQAPSETPVHSVQNGLNPAWSNPYATGSIIDVRNAPGSFNDAASLSSLPMSPAFSYGSLPNFPVSPFVYNSTSNLSHHSSYDHHSDLLNPVELLTHEFNALKINNNHRLHQFLNKDKEDKDDEKQEVKKVSEKTNEVKDMVLNDTKQDEITKTNNEAKAHKVENDKQDQGHDCKSDDNDITINEQLQQKKKEMIQINETNVQTNNNVSYPMNLINVNSAAGPTTLQTTPLHVKPPFIPLSTIPQYYVLNKDVANSTNVSSLCQLPQHIQIQLMKQGLPQNALILPIDQMENFKKLLQANKHNSNFMANLTNNNININHQNRNPHENSNKNVRFGDNYNSNKQQQQQQ